jgi:ectoine hydroxylase-related dioxygenase (phytanoyl-CoA dioxygenase family)
MSTAAQSFAASARVGFERDGFHLVDGVLDTGVVASALAGVAAVVAGRYESGQAPIRASGDDGESLVKIDASHLSDSRVRAAVTDPAIGGWAAALTGARRVQVWATQLLVKPPGSGSRGHVGWHQDYAYWRYWEPDSELLTAWIALSEVREDSGPMRFLVGSHRWGFREHGDFFGDQASSAQAAIAPDGRRARESPVLLGPGGVSFHHRLTVHGSGDNRSTEPRISLAVHLCTERSRRVPGARSVYIDHLEDERHAPVIFGT